MTNTAQAPACGPVAVRRVWRIEDGQSTEQDVEMVLEEPLSLHINGKQAAILMRLPGMEKELAAGFCISEGLVTRFADVLTIHHCGRGLPAPGEEDETGAESRNQVDVLVRPEALREDARLDVVRLIRAGCGAVDVDRAQLPLSPVGMSDRAPAPGVDYQTILGLEKTMRAAQQLHQQAGGVHAAALFDATGSLVILCEDVGRHNAVDKALGFCMLRDIPLHDKLLLCSGRFSYEMVTKIIRMGIPMLASFSAPTALGVQLADQFNVTLIGYLRGRRMTIYTHPERVIMP